MTGKTNIQVIDELFHIMEDIDQEENNIISEDISVGQNKEDNISSKEEEKSNSFIDISDLDNLYNLHILENDINNYSFNHSMENDINNYSFNNYDENKYNFLDKSFSKNLSINNNSKEESLNVNISLEINKLKIEREKLNIFTLEIIELKEELKHILLGE